MQAPAQQYLQLHSRIHSSQWPCIANDTLVKQHQGLYIHAQGMHCLQLQIRSDRLLLQPKSIQTLCTSWSLPPHSGKGRHSAVGLFRQSGCIHAQCHSEARRGLSKYLFQSTDTAPARQSTVAAGAKSAVCSEDPLQGDHMTPFCAILYYQQYIHCNTETPS